MLLSLEMLVLSEAQFCALFSYSGMICSFKGTVAIQMFQISTRTHVSSKEEQLDGEMFPLQQ